MKNITEGKLIKTEFGFKLNDLDGIYVASVQTGSLSLENCEAIANGYDLDELKKHSEWKQKASMYDTHIQYLLEKAFDEGFQEALELMGDKKFSEEQLREAFLYVQNEPTFDIFKQSLQQTEWDVEIDKLPSIEGWIPKLDSKGKMILKIKK